MDNTTAAAAQRVAAWADFYEQNRGPCGDQLAVSYADYPLDLSDLRQLLKAIEAPPTIEAREELIQVLDVSDPEGGVFEPSPEALNATWGQQADAVLSVFELRRRTHPEGASGGTA